MNCIEIHVSFFEIEFQKKHATELYFSFFIFPEYFHNLYRSLRNRCQEIIDSDGYTCRY